MAINILQNRGKNILKKLPKRFAQKEKVPYICTRNQQMAP
jgi:hypothetical protein